MAEPAKGHVPARSSARPPAAQEREPLQGESSAPLGNQALQRLIRTEGTPLGALGGARLGLSNQALQRAARSFHPAVPIQRQVALTRQKAKGDFVELTSINYAVTEAGGPVGTLAESDFSKLGKGGTLFLVGHGAPGKSGDYTAAQICNILFNGPKALTEPPQSIKFTSCYAGKGETDDQTDSVVAAITKALSDKKWDGVQVTGALGPSIKSTELGKDFTVVDPAKGEQVGKIQQALENIHKPREKTKAAIAEAETKQGGPLTLEEKAAIASRETGDFYRDLVKAISDPQGFQEYLVREAKPGGKLEDFGDSVDILQELVTEKTSLDKGMLDLVSKRQKGKCFITTACTEARGLPDDCRELQVLRHFRDNYVRALPGGDALIAQYYALAPVILNRLRGRPEAPAVLKALYGQVAEAVGYVEAGLPERAMDVYCAAVRALAAAYLPRRTHRQHREDRHVHNGYSRSAWAARRRSAGRGLSGIARRRPRAGAAPVRGRGRRWRPAVPPDGPPGGPRRSQVHQDHSPVRRRTA